MTRAQHQVNARNQSALLNATVRRSTIVATFWWPFSRADIACMLRTSAGHVQHVWLKAKERGELPNIARPARGFDLRREAIGRAA